MNESSIRQTAGGCLCGLVRYTIEARPGHLDYCHCAMCRKFGGPMGLEIDPAGIEWSGEENIQTYASSDWAVRGFCKVCGSSLFWRMTSKGQGPGFMSLNAGTLDDMNGLPLKTEIYIEYKPDGFAFAGETQKMTEAEVMAEFADSQKGDS